MFEDDFVLRAAKQFAAMVARAMKQSQAGEEAQAKQTLDETYDELLGPKREFLDLVDGTTLFHLISDHETANALAELCAADAALSEAQDSPVRAKLRATQARDLWRAVLLEKNDLQIKENLAKVAALIERVSG